MSSEIAYSIVVLLMDAFKLFIKQVLLVLQLREDFMMFSCSSLQNKNHRSAMM